MELSDKLVLLRGQDSRSSVADRLKIQESTLRNYEKAFSLPNFDTIKKICVEFDVTPAWLLFNEGPMRPGEPPQPAETTPQQPVNTTETANCARCAKMETELELERQERRELTQENRQLWKKNSELSAKCATLEERQKTCCPDPLLRQPPSALSNETQLFIPQEGAS